MSLACAPGSWWTPERQAALETLAAARLSAGEIAPRLGDGCTRGRVSGRAWRTGVTLRGAPRGGDPAAAGRASAAARRLNPIHLVQVGDRSPAA